MLIFIIFLASFLTPVLSDGKKSLEIPSQLNIWTLEQLRLYNPQKGMVFSTSWTATFHLSRSAPNSCPSELGPGHSYVECPPSHISLLCGEYAEEGLWRSCVRWLGMPEGE